MTINCKGHLIDLSSPKVMGILNITPDSFYDGGKHNSEKAIIKHVEQMLLEGATFIDIGAYSSKPGADFVSEDEELARILPIITRVLKEFPEALLSIDTFRSRVAKECIQMGAALINDISAGKLDDTMLNTVADLHVPYIMMHMKGMPGNMMKNNKYNKLNYNTLYVGSVASAKIKHQVLN